MSEAKLCPHCGASIVAESDNPRPEPSPSVTHPEPITARLPVSSDDITVVPLLAPGSNDDTFLSTPYGRKIAPAEPDPILGEYVESISAITAVIPVIDEESIARQTPTSNSSSFPAIDSASAPDSSLVTIQKVVTSEPVRSIAAAVEEDDDEIDEPKSGWSGVLIASYASAVTLALIWIMVKDRSAEKPTQTSTSKTETLAPQARQRDLSKVVQPPEPIVGEHFATLGQTLEIGSLAITPLDVKRQDVKLQRANVLSVPELRDGGKKALVLRLKLQNMTNNTIFAPLDQVYLRQSGDQPVDTFVTTADGERIYPYPLAVESEWSVVGQDFRELRPGESRTVTIATAPDAPADDSGPFSWRIRLRTGLDRTDLIGVIWPKPVASPAKPPATKK